MRLVGLAGGLASGKSSVTAILRENHHIPIIETEECSKRILAPGHPVHSSFVSAFGDGVLLPGSLDINLPLIYKKMHQDTYYRKMVRVLYHPPMRKEILKEVLRHWIRGEGLVVITSQRLIESGLHAWVGSLVVVHCNENSQLKRICARGLSKERALEAIAIEIPLPQKCQIADFVISTDCSDEEVANQAKAIFSELQPRKIWTWFWWLMPFYVLGACALVFMGIGIVMLRGVSRIVTWAW